MSSPTPVHLIMKNACYLSYFLWVRKLINGMFPPNFKRVGGGAYYFELFSLVR